ncbi:MAG: exosortase-associated EpsI family protein [Caldilineaceae bacterium]|nr:exosortase-associated EpsI family protein [Caldilineaceae bacterium]MBP8110502.1 exosortase-associated EpsI family protein [Caldilineaceae bacterium]MBP8125146.1 exosortase-associated EpsI family protein [Caldilineaceae bacterium]MBP9072106.1 exosortase-associated EpsI family protein [Caldilineaceae bacterium]
MYGPSSRRTLILAGLMLAVAIVAVYAPGLRDLVRPGAGEDGFTYVADLDFWQRTPRQQTVTARMPLDLAQDLAAQIPLTLGTWTGEDVAQTNIEVFILLEPEQFVQRLYWDDQGRYVWLSLIGGRSSQPFHPPDLCYDADGWRTSMSSRAVALPEGGEVYGLWLDAKKSAPDVPDDEHLIFYLYLFPNAERNPADGIVLLKLTSPRYGSDAETLAVQQDLLGHLLAKAGEPGS